MEKEPKRDLDPRTLFVRGISFDVGETELTEAFSALGPVRHAFIVKDNRTGRHKGYGFVQYALQEDAERAAQELHGTELGGRKVKIESAKKRAPLEERKTGKRKQTTEANEEEPTKVEEGSEDEVPVAAAKEPVLKKSRPEQPKPAEKPAKPAARGKKPQRTPQEIAENLEKHVLVRTVALGGLTPESIDAAVALANKQGGEAVEAIEKPAPVDTVRKFKLTLDGCSGEVILVRYKTVKDTMAAIAALHGQSVSAAPAPGEGGKKKKGGKSDGPKVQLWARQVSGEGLHLKRWRVVVRNLSFKATEDDLRTAFAPAGFVWEVTVPRGADGKPRGFAFVGFICRAHAERGIKAVNGTKVAGRPVAVDWAVAKRDFEQGTVAAPAPEAIAGLDKADEMSGSETESDYESDLDFEAGEGKRKNRLPVVSYEIIFQFLFLPIGR